MNEFTKQALALCGESVVEVGEVMQIFDDGVCFCELSDDGDYQFLINAEVHNFADRKYKPHDTIAVKLAFFYTADGRIYKDENEFLTEEQGKLAPETFIPISEYDEDGTYRALPSAFICGKVIGREHICIDGHPMLHIRLACLGHEADLLLIENILPFCDSGNIICGVFDVIGVCV